VYEIVASYLNNRKRREIIELEESSKVSIQILGSDTPFPDAGRPVIDLDDAGAVADALLAHAEPRDGLLARQQLAAAGDALTVGQGDG
jgi:hypothetical protein